MPRRARVGMDVPDGAASGSKSARLAAAFPAERPAVLRRPGPVRKLRLPDLLPVAPIEHRSSCAKADEHAIAQPDPAREHKAFRVARMGKEYLSMWKAHLTLSGDKSWILYPPSAHNRGADAMAATAPPPTVLDRVRLSGGLGEEEIIGLLRRMPWLHSLPDADLRIIYRRARPRAFPRYATILREGTVCHAVHILLHGQLSCVSVSKGTSVVRNACSYFGENCLVAQEEAVMEASIFAMEDSCEPLPIATYAFGTLDCCSARNGSID